MTSMTCSGFHPQYMMYYICPPDQSRKMVGMLYLVGGCTVAWEASGHSLAAKSEISATIFGISSMHPTGTAPAGLPDSQGLLWGPW